MSADHCGYAVTDDEGEQQPCGRPVTGWRWYQDVGEHEDMLDVGDEVGDASATFVLMPDAGERDRAREIAVALEQRLAKVEALADGWEQTDPVEWALAGRDAGRLAAADLRAALEADQ